MVLFVPIFFHVLAVAFVGISSRNNKKEKKILVKIKVKEWKKKKKLKCNGKRERTMGV